MQKLYPLTNTLLCVRRPSAHDGPPCTPPAHEPETLRRRLSLFMMPSDPCLEQLESIDAQVGFFSPSQIFNDRRNSLDNDVATSLRAHSFTIYDSTSALSHRRMTQREVKELCFPPTLHPPSLSYKCNDENGPTPSGTTLSSPHMFLSPELGSIFRGSSSSAEGPNFPKQANTIA